eukprot:CAMPEP_0202394476 /NCGR_PEP_ID=MMETSP1127-20130417/93451_1 /ASSEMBLY_ACC=CAM_ASM_000462 /TAXON_ID=3047 /ORGANISM="Dunaliella tertiolecta, Strain CCMP1320" /LENGTH=673 /DNA_ID=CAMNT_0048997101 /DNA_START=29 /DNA_END=2048 /DNA_ORIENTATION=-
MADPIACIDHDTYVKCFDVLAAKPDIDDSLRNTCMAWKRQFLENADKMLAMLNIMQICEDCGANAVTMLRYSQDIIKQEQREGHSGQHFAAGQRQVQQQQQAAAQRAQQQRQQQQQAAAQRAQAWGLYITPSAAAPSVSSGPSPRITAYSQQLTNLVKGPDEPALRPSRGTDAKSALQASQCVDNLTMSMEQARAAVWSQEASFLQMRCSMGMQALQARINPMMPTGGGAPGDPLFSTHCRAIICASTSSQLFEDALRTVESSLEPQERDSLRALWSARSKSEVLSCAFIFLRGFHPPYNTFTPDLRRVKRGGTLGKLLEAEGFFKKDEQQAKHAELGMWMTADRLGVKAVTPNALPQKRQLQEWAMPEPDTDGLGASLSSLALELISLVVENVLRTPDPPKALFDASSTAQTSAAGAPPPDTQSSCHNSLRSRLARKAEQQQFKRLEAEWLQKTKHIQVSQSMRWRDLLVVLSNLTSFFKPDPRIPRTFWRLPVLAHVAASFCRMLGLVFLRAENKEPLALKLLACPSAEELAGILTTQISSLAMQWSMTSQPKETLPSFWLKKHPTPLHQDVLLKQLNSMHDVRLMAAAPEGTDRLLRDVERCWEFALACWYEVPKEQEQAISPTLDISSVKRKGVGSGGRNSGSSSNSNAAVSAYSGSTTASNISPAVFW